MKSIKQIALSLMVTIGAFSMVTYTACTKDACAGITCSNVGTCSGGNCICPVGYEGSNCEILSKTKFVGVFVGNEICSVGTDQYSITMSSASGDLQLTLGGLYNQGFTATCTITGTNTFSFTGSSNATTYSGNGTLNTNQLVISYQISNGTVSNACTFTGNR